MNLVFMHTKRKDILKIFVVRNTPNKDEMFMATTDNAYLNYCQATVIQNRIQTNVSKFIEDPLVTTCIMIYLVGLLKDKTLSWIKFIDDMHNLIFHEHEHFYFHRLRFMRNNDLFNWESWQDQIFQINAEVADLVRNTS